MGTTTKRVKVSENRKRFLTVARTLSDKQLFSILSALRGPDHDKGGVESLKHSITTRIRHVMFGIEDWHSIERAYSKGGEYLINGSFYNGTPLTKSELEEVKSTASRAYESCQYHFLNHLAAAVSALGDRFPVVEGVTTYEVVQALKGFWY